MLTPEHINCISEHLSDASENANKLVFSCGDLSVEAYRGGMHNDFHLILTQGGELLSDAHVEELCQNIFHGKPHIFNHHDNGWRIAGLLPVTCDIKNCPERAEEIIKLLDKVFGDGYMTLEDVESYLFQKNHFGKLLLYNEELIGLILYRLLDETSSEEINAYNGIFTPHSDIRATLNSSAVIDTLLVAEEHQGQGHGKTLVRLALQEIKQQLGAENIITISWLNERPVNSDKIFLGFGFKEICVIKEFWLLDSIEKDYSCPVCGTPCKCSAKFLSLKI